MRQKNLKIRDKIRIYRKENNLVDPLSEGSNKKKEITKIETKIKDINSNIKKLGILKEKFLKGIQN